MRTPKLLFVLVTVTLTTMVAPDAGAYPARIHIKLANGLTDHLCWNRQNGHGNRIELLAPILDKDGNDLYKTDRYVLVEERDAAAICDNIEFFRGGAVGPDNTVFPGLTDPSHAVQYQPYSQCQALLEASKNGAERAYALGCFMHGAADNVGHHMVNFFTGETFTLFPKSALEEGDRELKFSWENVIFHFIVEDKLLKSAEAQIGWEFTPERMCHRIPHDLIKRVYFDPTEEGTGLWKWFSKINGLTARKNQALQASQMEGFDPAGELSRSIEDIRSGDVPYELDRRVIDAYVDFLRDGGAIEIVNYRPEGIGPADYVVMMPEIISDLKKLLALAERSGRQKAEFCRGLRDTTKYEYNKDRSEWECFTPDGDPISCPHLGCFLRRYLFDSDDGEQSRFQKAMERKYRELDLVVDAYIDSVERLSQIFVEKGMTNLTLNDIREGMGPFLGALDGVLSFPYEELLPGWMVWLYEAFEPLRRFLNSIEDMIKDKIKRYILDRVERYLQQLAEQLRALRDQMLGELVQRIEEIKQKLRDRIEAAVLRELGLDLEPDYFDQYPVFRDFLFGVMHMNSHNTMAGVLANTRVVFPLTQSSFYAGPTSFDASYQLLYNQLTLCPELRDVFYPCGVTAAEMLQPDFVYCRPLEGATLDSPIECHRYKETSFTASPDQASCRRVSLPDLRDSNGGHIGSYTLSFPPQLADVPPACNPEVLIPGVSYDPEQNKADWAGDNEKKDQGSGCATTSQGAVPALLAIMMMVLAVRRRNA